MAKHTPKEILEHHEKGAQHTHESAVQGTYDLGYARGEADVKERAVHKDPELAKEILDKRESDHEELEAKKRELANDDEEEAAPAARGKKAKDTGAEKTA
jgi:hypothetical protein